MGLKRKKRPGFEAPDLLALAARANRLDNGEILDQLDTTVSTVNQYTTGYRQTKDLLYLKELALAAQAVYVMAEEMLTRAGEPGSIPTAPPARQIKSARPY